MLYLTLTAVHVVAIIVWIGGMLLAAILLASMRPANGPFLLPEDRLLATLQRWDRRVTTPAMASAWALGLTLAPRWDTGSRRPGSLPSSRSYWHCWHCTESRLERCDA